MMIRNVVLPILFSSSSNPIKSLFKKLNAWIVSGIEKNSEENICILYIGEESTKHYITELLFGKIFTETFYQQKSKSELISLYHKKRNNIDILFINAHGDLFKTSHHKKYFSTPKWINSITTLPLDESKKSVKSDIRKIINNKLKYRITRNIEELAIFYSEMLIPYMQHRHGDKSIPLDFETIHNRIDKKECVLLLVESGRETISGVLIIQEKNKTPLLWRNGLKHGDTKLWKLGAIFATYYFSSEYLYRLGYKHMNLGNTRSFLNDGVLNYKKKWPLTIKSATKSHLLIIPNNVTEGIGSFLTNNTFIFNKNKKELGLAIFHAPDKEQTISSFKGIAETKHFMLKDKVLISK
ncbi:hypothetical protein [Chlorobium limicola]